jgi:hypothetical protein
MQRLATDQGALMVCPHMVSYKQIYYQYAYQFFIAASKESSVTRARGLPSAMVRMSSSEARCHNQPTIQYQQPKMRVKKLQRDAQKYFLQ